MIAMMIMMIQVLTKLCAEHDPKYACWNYFLGQLQLELGMFRLSCWRSGIEHTSISERLAFKIVEANIISANKPLGRGRRNLKRFLGFVNNDSLCKLRFGQYFLILEKEEFSEIKEYLVQKEGLGMLWSFAHPDTDESDADESVTDESV